MPSLIYNSAFDDEANGRINFGSDQFYVMLVTSDYFPDKDAHTKRSDIDGEVAPSGGYVAGGLVAVVTVTKDNSNDRLNIGLGGISFTGTVTARGAVYYKSRGGDPSDDELVAYVDFGADIVSTNATWSLSQSTLRIQN